MAGFYSARSETIPPLPWPNLAPPFSLAPGTGKTQTARLWTYARDERPWGGTAPPAAWYRFSGDRKGQHPKDHLARYRGWMHADGYAGFEPLAASGEVQLAACWAHARRKFYEIAEATKSPVSVEALRRIGELYAIEAQVRGQSAALRKASTDTGDLVASAIS